MLCCLYDSCRSLLNLHACVSAMARVWEVVGGVDKGGVLVRDGKDLSSLQLQTRLSTGATVEEIDLVEGRLHFRRVAGSGPTEGWISVSVSGKPLVKLRSSPTEKTTAKAPAARQAPGRQLPESSTTSPSPSASERSLQDSEVPFSSFQEYWVDVKDSAEPLEAEDSVFDLRVDLDSLEHINIRELPLADGVHASTGCQLWPASVALGRVLLSRPWLVQQKSVIELGAGCGFAGIAAARLAHKVLITDCDAETVANLHHNVARNWKIWHQVGTTKEISTATLDWRDLLKHGWPASRRMDVVIGSDIIYGNWGPMVAGVAEKVLNPSGQLVMVSAEDRGGLPEFRSALEMAGFRVDVSHWVDNGKRFLLYICARATQQSGGTSS